MLKLYNTMSRKIEEFVPINPPKVGMYTCGPTVYDYMHIGNLRTFLLSDILYRILTHKDNGYQVTAVQNITDIDDKIVKRAKEKNADPMDIALEFTNAFLIDVNRLNITFILREDKNHRPKATDYIEKMADFVQELMNKGFAYREPDGSIYFDISKFTNYGKLSGVVGRELKSGTRVLSDEYSKDDIQDFALWKAVPKNEIGSYQSKLGWGRPGWHVECSAMSQSILGNKFDIHVGGVDLIFPHHENEIAQSEAKTGEKPFVRFWVHGEFLLVDGQKMSKSLGNFYTIKDIEQNNIEPLALRYLYLTAHYRTMMNFTWEALDGAQRALRNLKFKIRNLKSGGKSYRQEFLNAINDDLNMPQALAVAWQTENRDDLVEFDKVLGLDIFKIENKKIPDEIKKLLEEREEARKTKDFKKADELRGMIKTKGYDVNDSKIT
ncbi:MAG: cysteine--tRNA ligase [bacterium]|nr:cysteine--tRNA ligase [bacterium]